MADRQRFVHGIISAAPDAEVIPTVRGDQTLPLLRHGYGYLGQRMRQLGSSAFEGRLFGRRTVFLAGAPGARLFYDTDRIQRAGAVPSLVRLSPLGRRTVHVLDDEEHRHRKAVFHQITAPARIAELADLTERHWCEAIERWGRSSEVRLFDEAVGVLGTAGCEWAGLPPPRQSHLDDLAAAVDNFGVLGFGRLTGGAARRRADRWAAHHIEAVRAGHRQPAENSALRLIAEHRDRNGRLLPTRTAAAELLGVLRPIVAVAWLVCFAAHATHIHPLWRHRLGYADAATVLAFVDEVRRHYPFAPLLAARVREDFDWRGHDFPAGRWVVLDLYGTDHDPHRWPDPFRFDPNRFLGSPPDAFDFVPHGGGDPFAGHRCPGEDLTAALLVRAVRQLSRIDYHVPRRDLTVPCAGFPSHIPDGFVMTNVVSDSGVVIPPGIR